jgi:light-regulated signal transduction histidine kinase (bacteriophytochrome)
MERLVSDLIHISEIVRIDLNIQEVNPWDLVENILRSFNGEIEQRDITVQIKELPTCLADPGLLSNVYENLISNAIKFTQKKKKPEIIIGSQPDDSTDRVIYFIKDNGIGFNMIDHERIFETFQMLHEQDEFRGAGIGLTLAKKIINEHGGKLWAEAKKGKGATFYFDLKRGKQG